MSKAHFQKFVSQRRRIAEDNGLKWNMRINADGTVHQEDVWNLCAATGQPKQQKCRIDNLGAERATAEILTAKGEAVPEAFSNTWVDLLKATVIDWVFVENRQLKTVKDRRLRAARTIATCAGKTKPWELTPTLARKALETAKEVAPVLRETVETTLAWLFDGNQLSANGPLLTIALAGEPRYTWGAKAAGTEILANLADRKSSEKLPDRESYDAQWRILTEEVPRTVSDAILFEFTKVHHKTGLRITDCCMIPFDWRREIDYSQDGARRLEDHGGFSKAIGIRHFPGKQQGGRTQNGTVLPEDIHLIPPFLAPVVVGALENLERLTAPMRRIAKAQNQTGRLFPEFEKTALVPAWEFYPRLSGDLRLTGEIPEELEREYRRTLDPEILDQVWRSQTPPAAPFRKYVTGFFHQFGLRVSGEHGRAFPARTSDGSTWTGQKQWKDVYVRVGELEDAVRTYMPTKLPETNAYEVEDGSLLYPDDFLVLLPGRSIAEARNDVVIDVSRYFSVKVITAQDYRRRWGAKETSNLFKRYGNTEEERSLRITNTHSVRHLRTTEMFRGKAPDTAISKHDNRKSPMQSYTYDHRSLNELMDAIELPELAMEMLPQSAQKMLKAIATGTTSGPLIDRFFQIMEEEDDVAALEFLAAEVGGYHLTPYGICARSFLITGCPKYLECLNGCGNLTKTEDPGCAAAALDMKQKLELQVDQIERTGRPGPGRDARLKDAKTKLDNVITLIAAKPGMRVFPEGSDLSGLTSRKGTPLDAR